MKTIKCIICKKSFYNRFGHNAEPLKKGTCCDGCNDLVLIERIKQMLKQEKQINN